MSGRGACVLGLMACWNVAGCYRSHLEPRPSGDAGDEGTTEADAGLDAAPLDAVFDASPDAAAEAALDGSLDAGPDAPDADAGIDAPPDVGPPPVPGRCRTEPVAHPFEDPVQEARWPDGPVEHPQAVHVCSTPVVIDLEPPASGPLMPEIVFVSYPPLTADEPPGVLRIWDPRNRTTRSYPPSVEEPGVLEPTTNLAAGDLDGDGRNEIVGIGRFSGTYAFRSDASLMWESAHPTVSERGHRWARSVSGAVTLADLEGDGHVDVVVGRTVLDGRTGAHRWTGPEGTGRAVNQFLGPISCVADLDDDGVQEVIAGHTAFRADGTVMWNVPEEGDGFCAVADVFLDEPGPEVVLVANGFIRILEERSGRRLWLRAIEGRVRDSLGGAPTVGDFDGDGRVEIGVAHGAAYGVYDPECTARGRPRGCTGDGLLWKAEIGDDSSSGTGSSVFDFNGDGRAEVIYNDQYHFRVYDGTTGRVLFQHRSSSRTRTENPAIADADGDGEAEIVFTSNAEANFIRMFWTDPGVEIWGDRRGRWVGARRIWNQHAYHVTNVEENGSIPARETPGWTVLNAYRQNLREGGDVLAAPDLWGGRGRWTCTGPGRARLTVDVQNWGLERVGPGVSVRLYRDARPEDGGRFVAAASTTSILEPSGGRERVVFDVAVDSVTDFYAILDDPADPESGDRVAECLEDNNWVLFWRVAC
ncbi:MAG: VCBS repeat-containing protein [Myxococcota bacterium]|nr:VCBS repeat-containing protein [Myxococcota bacterium]MDW8361212.1 VCBS repeat-containing protein [Myxococcales bacterium]